MNPFAKKVVDQQLEKELVKEATGPGVVAMVSAALKAVAHRVKQRRMFRYGGFIKSGSIKQRTRFNREQRNAR